MRLEHSFRFGVSAACHAIGHKFCACGLAYTHFRITLGSHGRAHP